MISDLPFYIQPQFWFIICTFLYINGFLLAALCTNKLLFKTNKMPKTNVNVCLWLGFSLIWFMSGIVMMFFLTKSLFKDLVKKDKS